MSAIAKTAAVLACAGALLGIGSSAASASTTHAGTRSQLGSTQGFHVYNMTGDPLTLAGIQGGRQFGTAPAIGSVLQPGATATFEVTWVSSWDWDYITYRNAKGQPVSFQIGVEDGWIPSTKCYSSAAYECSRPFVHQKEITISEPQDTVHELDGLQAQAESQIVQRLCADGGAGTCGFTPEGDVKSDYSGRHVVATHENFGRKHDEWKVGTQDKVEQSNSLDISITAGSKFEAFGQEIELEVKTTYGHEWATSHAFDVSDVVTVEPGYTSFYYVQTPVLRYTGTVTVVIGNSTWKLHGVHFDVPDADGAIKTGHNEIRNPLVPLDPANPK